MVSIFMEAQIWSRLLHKKNSHPGSRACRSHRFKIFLAQGLGRVTTKQNDKMTSNDSTKVVFNKLFDRYLSIQHYSNLGIKFHEALLPNCYT